MYLTLNEIISIYIKKYNINLENKSHQLNLKTKFHAYKPQKMLMTYM